MRFRNFRLFFVGQSISLVGTWMQSLAMGWLVYRLTHSAILLGVVGFSSQIPAFIIAPFSGVLADRANRRMVLLITQSCSMLQAFLLGYLTLTHQLQIWQVILLALFMGCVNAVDIPVRHSFLLEMVEKKEMLGNAIALNSLMFNVAKLIGPSIAGIIIAAVGEGICFVLNGVSYIAVLWSLCAMRLPPFSKEIATVPVWKSMKDGFSYAYNHVPIRAVLILLAVVSCVGLPYAVLMPVFAKDVLRGDSQTLGFLVGAAGVGALLGTIFLASRREAVRLGRIIPLCALLFGFGLILFSFSRQMFWSCGILVLCGFGAMVQMAASNTFIQTIVDDDKRGRVMSLYTLSFMGTVPLGNLLTGFLASHAGAGNTLAFSGIVCIVSAMAFMVSMPAIRKAGTCLPDDYEDCLN